MSGHSKWSTIKHKKGAKDARRSKIFTKLIKEITVAAKMGGGDMNANSRLRLAVNNARENNMPSDTIQRAIKKGTGGNDGVDYEEVLYEGYGPHNTAVVVKALTDNRNRTAGNVRAIFTKNGGNMGATNSVLYQFDHKGLIEVNKDDLTEDALTEFLLEAGGDDLADAGDHFLVTTAMEAMEKVKHYLEAKGATIRSAILTYLPQNKVVIDDMEQAEKVMHFLDKLEDDDDVQQVYSNFEISDKIAEQLA